MLSKSGNLDDDPWATEPMTRNKGVPPHGKHRVRFR
jgi:hypothetical protein